LGLVLAPLALIGAGVRRSVANFNPPPATENESETATDLHRTWGRKTLALLPWVTEGDHRGSGKTCKRGKKKSQYHQRGTGKGQKGGKKWMKKTSMGGSSPCVGELAMATGGEPTFAGGRKMGPKDFSVEAKRCLSGKSKWK